MIFNKIVSMLFSLMILVVAYSQCMNTQEKILVDIDSTRVAKQKEIMARDFNRAAVEAGFVDAAARVRFVCTEDLSPGKLRQLCNKNTCGKCCESLIGRRIVACACIHMFHMDCFNTMFAKVSSDEYIQCPVATCCSVLLPTFSAMYLADFAHVRIV